MALQRVFLALLVIGASWARAQDTSLRDPEALYLDGLAGQPPIILKALTLTPVYATRTLNAHVGNLVQGEAVILIAHHPDSYLVRAKTGKLEGWVASKNLETPDPAVLNNLRAAQDEEARYQNAIKKKEVIAGMTFTHVLQAMGKPDNKSFREDENGRFDLWSYITYETVIQQRPYRDPVTGQYFTEMIRVKVPSGSLDVEFKEGRVSALEKTRGTTKKQGIIRYR